MPLKITSSVPHLFAVGSTGGAHGTSRHLYQCVPVGSPHNAQNTCLSQMLIQCLYLFVHPPQAFDHPNIVKLLDVMKADNDKDIYLVFEHMDTDLHRARKLFVMPHASKTNIYRIVPPFSV